MAENETPETEAERLAREEADNERAGKRGRHPDDCKCSKCGVKAGAKPKMTDATFLAGCRTFVKLMWYLSHGVARVFGFRLAKLSDEKITEGAEEARNLLSRFSWAVLFLMIIGFPVWLIATIYEHAERIIKPAEKPAMQLVPPEGKTDESANSN